ncbi:acyltransferase domain-containing protein [Mucilaginibacter sp. HC2]|uniref:acyltransferase domain-containing protein n=1 Tax=Mucilaginibacter inviolabilis TaxID=2714892 RepID=UPI0014098189|nr:acyltransferase domain-containing protein [Mucilaginibacter inviolabilis]NHA02808.1 acyltransferase domain-containing protein [Mucilaginibacter inviolabilis]
MQNTKIIDRHVVLLFSGQGSHYRGMGQQLYEQNEVFKNSIEKMDLVVRQQLRRSLIDELYIKTDEPFDDLLITHPAIVAVEIALFHVIQELGIKPAYVSGNSLGEFAAGVAKGIWSAETAVIAAIEQAKSIQRCHIEGGLLAVLAEEEKMRSLYKQHQLFLAADNFPGHFTLAGSLSQLDQFEMILTKQNITFLRLPVASPFHSPLMRDAERSFRYHTGCSPQLRQAEHGFVSGFSGQELSVLPENYFWEAIFQYTNFPAVIDFFIKKGPCLFLDMGPSGTIATFSKYNLRPSANSVVFHIMNPFKKEMEQLEKLKEMIMADQKAKVEKFHVSGSDIKNQCYVCHKNNTGILVDPAWDYDLINDYLLDNRILLKAILLTHAHKDHTDLAAVFSEAYGVPVYMSALEIHQYSFECPNLQPAIHLEEIIISDYSIVPIHTPGHTIGSMCFLIDGHIFTGDTVFIEGVGICDNINVNLLFDSIQFLKQYLPANTICWPGHSFGDTPGKDFGFLLKNNIYFQFDDRAQFVEFRMRKNSFDAFAFK